MSIMITAFAYCAGLRRSDLRLRGAERTLARFLRTRMPAISAATHARERVRHRVQRVTPNAFCTSRHADAISFLSPSANALARDSSQSF